MNGVFGGKTAAQWIDALRFGDVAERCEAALALAEFAQSAHTAKAALHAALEDSEAPVQAAAEIALGFIPVSVENRREMFDDLGGSDETMRQAVLQQLDSLAKDEVAFQTPPAIPDERIASGEVQSAQTAAVDETAVRPQTPATEPDIAIVRGLPWLFLLMGIVAFAGVAWACRGISWSRWPMAVTLILAGLFITFARPSEKKDALSSKRFRARARFAWAAIVACAAGLVIVSVFPSGSIIIDNESSVPVHILLDGAEWLTISSGETKKRDLTRGKYRLTIQSVEGNRVLDAHDIKVAAHNRYILNVLGAQVYFEGVVQYGIDGGSMKVVTEKWFPLPEVDCLFRNPPERIFSVNPVNKSYFTRGAPPKLIGEERH